jgi:hypothetical protein
MSFLGGLFKTKKPKQDVTQYFMSIHFGVCTGPVDDITGIYVGEKTAWEGSLADGQTLYINNPELFGGIKKEGGVSGNVSALYGAQAQVISNAIKARFNADTSLVPSFRGLTSLFFNSFYWCANSPYLRPVWVRVRRQPRTVLPAALNVIGANANPAAIVLEALTNSDWGMGAGIDQIDYPSFLACAQTLASEGFGLSMMWTRQTKIEDFCGEVNDHVQAMMFIHPRTGLINLKLLRDDYDRATCPVLNPDNSLLYNPDRLAWGEVINEIVVTWTNPANEQEETVTAQDLTGMAIAGAPISASRNYYGVRDKDLASKLAFRDLRQSGALLFSCEIECTLFGIVPGDVVRLDWPEDGITGMYCRVLQADLQATSTVKTRLKLMEDIFSLGSATYTTPPGSDFVDPSEDPRPMVAQRILNLPAALVPLAKEDATAAAMQPPETYIAILAAQTGTDTIGYELEEWDGSSWQAAGSRNIVPIGQLSAALPAAVTSLVTVADVIGPAVPAIGDLLLIGAGDDRQAELALVTAYDGATDRYTIRRGALDTVPRTWPAGSPVWAFGDGRIYDPVRRADGDDPQFKLLSRTSKGVLANAAAPVLTDDLIARPLLPLRPANVRVEGQLLGPVVLDQATTEFTVTWAHRNRLTESEPLAWDAASAQPEAGQTARVRVLDAQTRAVLADHPALVGTSITIDVISLANVDNLVIQVTAERSGLLSLQAAEVVVLIGDPTGYGVDYGNDYGGS